MVIDITFFIQYYMSVITITEHATRVELLIIKALYNTITIRHPGERLTSHVDTT